MLSGREFGADAPPADEDAPLRAARSFLKSFDDNAPIGIAVSGGGDSTGLLSALTELAGPDRLVALTVDHGLRPESADEARAVAALCARLGVVHETLPWQGLKTATGVQAAAREARYRLLAAAARRHRLAAIVTAHTAEDQAETLAMRGMRIGVTGETEAGDAPTDSGRFGLAGIPPATLYEETIWFLRPLLGVGRAAIRNHLRSRSLSWFDDPSNDDLRFERVRIRKGGAPVPLVGLAKAWQQRLARAERTAALIEARCERDRFDRFEFEARGLAAGDVEAVLVAMIDMAGGRKRALDRKGRGRIAALAQSDGAARETVGRTLIERDATTFRLRRERRDIPKLSVAPGASADWDGRYRVTNPPTSCGVVVTGGGPDRILPEFGASGGTMSQSRAAPDPPDPLRLCGRVSHLMPVFELAQANALARLAGRCEFPPCPWRSWAEVAG